MNPRRLRLPSLLAALSLVPAMVLAPVAPRAAAEPLPLGGYTSPDRRTGPLPFVEIDGMGKAPDGTGMERYTSQKVQWRSCDTGEECATIKVPMDHANPDGVAIDLRLSRRKAEGKRKGVMLVNPGGPGAPGIGMADAEMPGVSGYDIIGFDPRGTGESTPVRCYPRNDEKAKAASDTRAEIDQSPDTDKEYQDLLANLRQFGDSCAQNSGVYLSYVTTDQVVQDMDLIRQLLGETKLNYLGYSYGTYLGAMYAHYYPTATGRVVLDSPVNVQVDDTVSQAQGFDRALDNFAEWAAERGKLGSTKAEVVAKVKKLLTEVDQKPLPAGGRTLTQSQATSGVLAVLYGTEDVWLSLELALLQTERGKGTALLAMADQMNDRDARGYGPGFDAFPAMACADSPDRGLKVGYDQWAEEKRKAPVFGAFFGPSTQCEQWPVAPQHPVNVATKAAEPVLVVGSTGDPATPYEYAPTMVKVLGNARLLTWDGPGHGTYGGDSSCINDAVASYLEDGTLPAENTTCKPE